MKILDDSSFIEQKTFYVFFFERGWCIGMTKKTLLIILLVGFVFGAFSVGGKLLNAYDETKKEGKGNEYESTSMDQDSSFDEEEYDDSDENYEDDSGNNYEDDTNIGESGDNSVEEQEEAFDSGDVVDLIDDDIPCIFGSADNLYNKNELDPYDSDEDDQNDYYKSNYGTKFTKLLNCGDNETSFSLGKKFSTLSFTTGIWDNENNNGFMVIIYKGNQSKKKSILKAKVTPGQKPKDFSVDVSDCDTITIKAVFLEYSFGSAVTDGFKLTYK